MDKPSTTEKEWESHGLKCKVVFCRQSHRCGYVAVPLGHPAAGLSYDDLPVNVHGGLTYGQDKQGFYGFDCAHAGDRVMEYSFDGDDHFWTLEEVEKETERLAEQLSKLTWNDIVKAKLDDMPEWFSKRVQMKEAG